MELRPVNRTEFSKFITSDRGDKFAKTFVPKCDMIKAWDKAMGVWQGSELCGAVVLTISKRLPFCANLQLLHTFQKHRGKGVGTMLCNWAIARAIALGALYFRISSEPNAVEFYRKLGFRFWGKQKSGCYLSLFVINSENIHDGIYDDHDAFINNKLSRRGKGSLTEKFTEII